MFFVFCFSFSLAIDHVIGCGQRNGQKYFLVRFRGQNQNEIIDWETAKEHAIEVMEFFGSRTIWTDVNNIIDPEICLDENSGHEMPSTSQRTRQRTENMPSTSQLDACPNEIQFKK